MSRQKSDRRRGATLLEVILVLPIVLIAVLAIVEFGLLFSNSQQLEMAARAGGLASVETSLLSSGTVPQSVVDVIDESLRASKILGPGETIEDVGGVRIQHSFGAEPNSSPLPNYTLTAGEPTDPVMFEVPTRPYVHITVSLPTTRLAPNVLLQFGIDLQDRVSSQSKLFRHEL